MTKFEISYAYLFMSLGFVLVMVLSAVLLSEQVTCTRAVGTLIVICGVLVLGR
ncbi:MAG: hypothetical protein GTO24_07615 [candidate division Zixibacteria bacterium]|nr:hypothetical protein [candidate division Zixibacteria bacterium]